MSDRWTPGPWAAIRSIPEEGCDGWWIKAQPHAALRGFTHDFAWVNGGQENEGNARLISAAPDMAEALDAILSAGYVQDVEAAKRAIALCRAALAKARGQA